MVADLRAFDQATGDVMELFKKFEGAPVHAHGAEIHAVDYTHTWRNRAGLENSGAVYLGFWLRRLLPASNACNARNCSS
jgi:hypothetical protein